MEPEPLNKSQKRAISLNKDVSNLNVTHLFTFIDGMVHPEPPAYQLVQGVIQPPLAKVTMKEGASSYDFGNVIYHQGVQHIMVQIEKGQILMKKKEGLKVEEENLLSHPIQSFVALEALELWKIKYQAIVEAVDKINTLRAFAHNLLQQPVGRSINDLAPSPNDDFDGKPNNAEPLKRKPGESIVQHPCNKHPKVCLDVSAADKIDAVSNISDQVKIDLYDAITKSAVPNSPASVDNIIMAGWNVVSIYTQVGTDSAELTKSILELKTVLSEFEGGKGKKKRVKEDQSDAPRLDITNLESSPAPPALDNSTPPKSASPVMARKIAPPGVRHLPAEGHAHVRPHQPAPSGIQPVKPLLPHQRRLGALKALQMYAKPDSDRGSPEGQQDRGRFGPPLLKQHQHQHQHPDLVGLVVGSPSIQEGPRAPRQPSSLAAAVNGTKKDNENGMGMTLGRKAPAPVAYSAARERERQQEKQWVKQWDMEQERAAAYFP